MAPERGAVAVDVGKIKLASAIVAIAVLAAACWTSFTTSLKVHIGGPYGERVFQIEWPHESGENVTMNNSLTDSSGLAGLEIAIVTPDGRTSTLTVADFDSDLYSKPLEVPNEGLATIILTMRQANVVVARGHTSWNLEHDVHTWEAEVERAPYSWGATRADAECGWWWCYRVVRIEIDEAVRNYPAEALWLQLRRFP